MSEIALDGRMEATRWRLRSPSAWVTAAWRWLAARWQLRRVQSVGRNVGVRGRVRVDATGRIQIGEGVRFHAHLSRTQLSSGPGARLTIGPGTFVNHGAILSARHEVRIGARCQIAPHVVVMDSDFHDAQDLSRPGKSAAVIIEDDVWLATRSMVLRGVRIGRGAVVAAGAVVTHDVAPRTLVAGVPARVVRRLDRSEEAS